MFFTFPLPSQKKALDYFEKAVRMLNGKFILGGHSKGGNLAVYAGAFTDENSRNHIDYIYNFDGPGFSLDKIRDFMKLTTESTPLFRSQAFSA